MPESKVNPGIAGSWGHGDSFGPKSNDYTNTCQFVLVVFGSSSHTIRVVVGIVTSVVGIVTSVVGIVASFIDLVGSGCVGILVTAVIDIAIRYN